MMCHRPLIVALLLAANVGCASHSNRAGSALAPVEPAPDNTLSAALERADEAIGSARRESREMTVRVAVPWAFVDAHEIRDLAATDGVLWVATTGGVLRVVDGIVTGRITVVDGLLNNHVSSIHARENGELWIGFEGPGCQVLRAGHLEPCSGQLDEARISAWADFDGAIYAATWDGSLFRVDSETRQAQLLPFSHRQVSSLVTCGGELWVGSLGYGVGRVDVRGLWSVRESPRIVEAMACRDGVLHVGGPEGLAAYHGASLQPVDLFSRRRHVRALGASDVGLYVGLSDGQVRMLRGGEATSLEVPYPATIFADTGDFVWLAGDGGLVGLDSATHSQLLEVQLPGPGSNDIAAVTSAGEQLALGLFNGGLALWTRQGWVRVTEDDGLPTDQVNSIAYDKNENLWVATTRGLARVSRVGAVDMVLRAPELPCDHMNAVVAVQSSAGVETIAVASSCGVGFVEPAHGAVLAWESREEGLPHRIVYDLVDWEGTLVAATNDGLALREHVGDVWSWQAMRAGRLALEDNWITAVEVSAWGELLVGTYSGGLFIGHDLMSLQRVEGPRYVNPTALVSFGNTVLVGGLAEGAHSISRAGSAPLQPRSCLMGDDVTGFTHWNDRLVVATRSGAAVCVSSTP